MLGALDLFSRHEVGTRTVQPPRDEYPNAQSIYRHIAYISFENKLKSIGTRISCIWSSRRVSCTQGNDFFYLCKKYLSISVQLSFSIDTVSSHILIK
jgi:hypothetical protein